MLEGLLTAIAFGTLWFWVVIAVSFILLLTSVVNECPGWATTIFTVLAFIYGPALVSKFGLITIIIGFAIYFLLGGFYSVWRWRAHAKEATDKFLEENKTKESRDKNKESFVSRKLNAANYKGEIYTNISFWPFVFVWYLLGGQEVLVTNQRI
jgi:hypothetical protein